MGNANARSFHVLLSIVIGFFIFDCISLAAYTFPLFNLILLPIVSITIWYSIVRDQRFMLILPLAELTWGSFGSSLQWTIGGFHLSLRILLFAICFAYWAYQRLNGRLMLKRFFRGDFAQYAVLLIPVGWAIFWGLAQSHPFGAVFYDGNAYIYLLYIPFWSLVYDSTMVPMLRSLCIGSATALSVKTLMLLNIFTNDYSALNAQYLYLWIRDTRIGEITPLGSALWRIFMQSQLYIGIAIVLLTVKSVSRKRLGQTDTSYLILFFAAIISSLSRSFWIGLAIALGSVFVASMIRRILSIGESLRLVLQYCAVILGSLSLIYLCVVIPKGSVDLQSLLTSRLTANDPAGTSRAQLLRPLAAAIMVNPILGQGFGATVTYRSSDPRIKTIANPEGLVTTYAFEWGYLDQWLKWGLLGMALWTFVIARQFIRGRLLLRKHGEGWVWPMSLLAGLVFILAVHVFSPYLNHPLGLGYLLLTMLVVQHSVDVHYA